MSDAAQRMSFLGGLVDRAFGLKPALQPRKASLFEPQAAAMVEPLVESTRDELSAPAAVPSYADTPPADQPAPRMRTALQTAIEIPLQPKQSAKPVAELVPHEIALRIEPAVPQSDTPALLPLALPPHIGTNTEIVTHREEVSHRVDHVVERSVEHVRDIVGSADGRLLSRRTRDPPTEVIAELVKPHHEVPAPVIGMLLAQPLAQDLVAPHAEAPGRPAPSTAVLEQPAPEGPVVNVTIGRVEVRAHSAPARASTDRRSAKPMSLDDYLKRRGGP